MNKATTELMRALTKLGPAELRSLLQEAFSRGAYHGERAIEYSNNQGLALTVEYSANANVKSVTAGPYLNKEDYLLLSPPLCPAGYSGSGHSCLK